MRSNERNTDRYGSAVAALLSLLKDTLRENCDHSEHCIKNCCVSHIIAPIFFVIFVLMAQFVLVNVVVAVLILRLAMRRGKDQPMAPAAPAAPALRLAYGVRACALAE